MSKRILAASVLIVLLSPLPAAAQATAPLPSPGLAPGNFFYIFDTMFEGIGTFFTFGQESKVRRYLELAEERLAELSELAATDDAEAQSEEDETGIKLSKPSPAMRKSWGRRFRGRRDGSGR